MYIHFWFFKLGSPGAILSRVGEDTVEVFCVACVQNVLCIVVATQIAIRVERMVDARQITLRVAQDANDNKGEEEHPKDAQTELVCDMALLVDVRFVILLVCAL